MLKILRNQSLQSLNSFGLPVKAAGLFEPASIGELTAYFSRHKAGEPFLLLGEGSNTLFINDYEGTVIHPVFKGIKVVEEDADRIIVSVGAGENWDLFVAHTVKNNWYGAENLSLIPGSVGSAPVQNIGAYGAEAGDIVYEVGVYNYEKGTAERMKAGQCRFGYRDSIFKSEEGKNLIVTDVSFMLSKKETFRLEYGNLAQRFGALDKRDLEGLRKTIITIRREKLPDPAETGNAGSFFKNPVIPGNQYDALLAEWPEIPGYRLQDGSVKIPAAWLIQQTGWKGFRDGDAGCWHLQPLVLVNYGSATGKDILNLSERISDSILKHFNISLDREVRVI